MQTKTLTTYQAYVAKTENAKLEPFSYEPKPLSLWDVEVEITHCGICHSDLHLIQNDWKNASYPLVPGHEIVGNVVAKGDAISHLKIGDRVGIGWQRSACLQCEWCLGGDETQCKQNRATCVGDFGGFASHIRVDGRFAFKLPKNLASENAAPLLCGGATVFSPIFHHVKATKRVGVVGIGGLGHLAIQFAKAFGAHVTAFSTSINKEKESKDLGADDFCLLKDLKSHEASIDFLMTTASENLDFALFLNLLRPYGELCLLGAPAAGEIKLPIFPLLIGKKVVRGSCIGSRGEIEKMLSFAAEHNIKAKIEIFPMSDVNSALDKLKKNQIHYRAVLKN